MSPKHPEITVRLVGEDGNSFSILGRGLRALREAGLPQAELDAFIAEATAGTYDELLPDRAALGRDHLSSFPEMRP